MKAKTMKQLTFLLSALLLVSGPLTAAAVELETIG